MYSKDHCGPQDKGVKLLTFLAIDMVQEVNGILDDTVTDIAIIPAEEE